MRKGGRLGREGGEEGREVRKIKNKFPQVLFARKYEINIFLNRMQFASCACTALVCVLDGWRGGGAPFMCESLSKIIQNICSCSKFL